MLNVIILKLNEFTIDKKSCFSDFQFCESSKSEHKNKIKNQREIAKLKYFYFKKRKCKHELGFVYFVTFIIEFVDCQ